MSLSSCEKPVYEDDDILGSKERKIGKRHVLSQRLSLEVGSSWLPYLSVDINKHSPRIELLVLGKFISRVSHRI